MKNEKIYKIVIDKNEFNLTYNEYLILSKIYKLKCEMDVLCESIYDNNDIELGFGGYDNAENYNFMVILGDLEVRSRYYDDVSLCNLLEKFREELLKDIKS